MRVHASGGLTGGVVRPPGSAGEFRDLDRMTMLSVAQSRQGLAAHAGGDAETLRHVACYQDDHVDAHREGLLQRMASVLAPQQDGASSGADERPRKRARTDGNA